MFRIAGTSGKVRVEGGDDDEGISTEAQGALLTRALGEARHHDLLASVYALRSDPGHGGAERRRARAGRRSSRTRRARSE